MIVTAKCWSFLQIKKELFCGRTILRFGAAFFVFIFRVFSSLAALHNRFLQIQLYKLMPLLFSIRLCRLHSWCTCENRNKKLCFLSSSIILVHVKVIILLYLSTLVMPKKKNPLSNYRHLQDNHLGVVINRAQFVICRPSGF